MSKKSILFLIVVVILTFIANHTPIIENGWEWITGDYLSGIAFSVQSYLLIVIIAVLLRKENGKENRK